jgi:hypothetical protein
LNQPARTRTPTLLSRTSQWRQARDFHARKVPGRAFRSPAKSGEYPAKPGEGVTANPPTPSARLQYHECQTLVCWIVKTQS